MPGGRSWNTRLDLAKAAPASGLNRQWARGRIDELIDAARLQGTGPDQAHIVDLSTRHNVISPFTSFVAVDQSRARPEAEPAGREALPTLLPAGNQPGMLRYPQTASFGPLFTVFGLVGLMFALAVVMLNRRQTL